MLPFTRNAFDPMDFTPMNLYKIQTRVNRRTTSAFELATAVVFLSGIQHSAESPEGMQHVPEFAKNFLRTLPDYWDDVKFLNGFPGKDVVVARRKANKWYVAGINGEAFAKTFNLNLSFLNNKKGQLISDAEGEKMLEQAEIFGGGNTTISVKPNGGFVAVF
jgi:alpha-glucosidase